MPRIIQKNQFCPNGYNKSTYESNFFVNEEESKVCYKCSHFTYSNGIGTCDLINSTFESNILNDNNDVFMEG